MIKKNADFNDIINKGELLKTKYYNIYYKVGDNDFPKFGLAVSKKLGNAVVRNKIKRQLRMLIDENKNKFSIKQNYIIIVKKSINEAKFADMRADLAQALEKGI